MVALHDKGPDLIIVSGDITQSATVSEFADAQAFLRDLPAPWLCIPGNHDLPGMDIERFTNPFGRYRRFIAEDLDPSFTSPLVDIKAINSARKILPYWNWANGGVSSQQCRETAKFFTASKAPWRMFVLHHPLVSARELPLDVKVMNRTAILKTLKEHRIDLVLAGHQHHAFTDVEEADGHKTIFLNASTATSIRLRKQPNGFNLLTFTQKDLRIDLFRLHNQDFEIFEAFSYVKP